MLPSPTDDPAVELQTVGLPILVTIPPSPVEVALQMDKSCIPNATDTTISISENLSGQSGTIPSSESPRLRDILAEINYHHHDFAKEQMAPLAVGDVAKFNAVKDPRVMSIHDIRDDEESYSLERQGFAVLRHETKVKEWLDYQKLKESYFPEIVELLKESFGGVEVLPFDLTLRAPISETSKHPEKIARNPLHTPHVDYSPRTALRWIEEKAGPISQIPHFIAVNVWRPLPPSSPVTSSPLALLAANTVANADLEHVEIKYLNLREGEVSEVKYNSSHKWYWLSHQKTDECWVFKQYDSADPMGRVPHTAIKVPEQGDGEGDGRWSIEVRCVIFFGKVDWVDRQEKASQVDLAGEPVDATSHQEDTPTRVVVLVGNPDFQDAGEPAEETLMPERSNNAFQIAEVLPDSEDDDPGELSDAMPRIDNKNRSSEVSVDFISKAAGAVKRRGGVHSNCTESEWNCWAN